MIMNRIADVFFIFGVVSIFFLFKTTNYFIVLNSLSFIILDDICILNFIVKKVVLITFFLFIGAIGKSAQLGFHT
jgi:NADH-quinone oxidoreductase subunit L